MDDTLSLIMLGVMVAIVAGGSDNCGEFEIENGDDDGKSPSAAADGKSIGKFLRMDTDGGECTIKADDDDGGPK